METHNVMNKENEVFNVALLIGNSLEMWRLICKRVLKTQIQNYTTHTHDQNSFT